MGAGGVMGLRDPNLSAGAIVEKFADGGALRNDGVRLKPASENPWYVLATVAGEQSDHSDDYLHYRNRRFWNGWMCQNLDEESRRKVAQALGLSESALQPLDLDQQNTLITRFNEAFPEDGVDLLRKLHQQVLKLSFLYFDKPFCAKNFYFAEDTSFRESFFGDRADFEHSYFAGRLNFDSAHLNSGAFFQNVYFSDSTQFGWARFEDLADFSNSKFIGFSDFRESEFCHDCDFSNGAFAGGTTFFNARFSFRVPIFYQSEMHQNTSFTEDTAFWPAPPFPDKAEDSKQAYTRLRQFAAGNQNPDLEHFFLRQEMRCKEVLAKGIDRWAFTAYRVLADYGISVARPLFALGIVYSLGVGIIGSYLRYVGLSPNPIGDGAMIALGNTLPFINISEKMHQEFYKQFPWWLDLLSATQSILGIILVFFIGLGLRNRFRLK